MIFAGDRVIVQGVPVFDHPDFASVSVPAGETLTAISARIFIDAARELDGYQDNVEAGEEILIANRAWHPDLAELTEDFMLLDGDTDHASVVWYRYNDNDELLARDHSHDPADIEVCRRHRDLAVAHAVPYAEFIRGVNLA